MRTIKHFDRELTVEEYIRYQLCKNVGTDNLVPKKDLVDRCRKLKLPVATSMTKSDLIDALIRAGATWAQLAADYGVGITTFDYQREFGIDHKTVKALEHRGLLTVVGKYRFDGWTKKSYAPLYDIYQFAEMTADQMQELVDQLPKRKKVAE